MATNVVSLIASNAQSLARDAIDTQKKIDRLNIELEPIKNQLREIAAGETETIEVPGKGKVSIAKPGKASMKNSLVGEYEEFVALSDEDRATVKRLLPSLKLQVKETKASAARVTITPNV